jgi:hypothetical protein
MFGGVMLGQFGLGFVSVFLGLRSKEAVHADVRYVYRTRGVNKTVKC